MKILALEFGTNLFGKLSTEVKERLQAVIDNPCQETWDEAYSIILTMKPMKTLWQAVAEIDPDMRREKPHGSLWFKIPEREVIIQAINNAILGKQNLN
jgi:hypothetical protein